MALARTTYEAPRPAAEPGEEVVTSTCAHNCGGRCVVNAHVREGRIVRITTDPRRWNPEHPPLHACVRGFGALERVNHPDRLRHPLRRTGPRGSGQYERVSWDEALDEVAAQMRRIREAHGPAAILDCSRTGSTAMLHSRVAVQRLLHLFGGCTELWSSISNEAETFALRHTYGPSADCKFSGREPTDYVNSRVMILWGWSPGDGHFGTGSLQYLKWAKDRGVRIVCVDPRVTRTSAQIADEHIAIRPGTDAAMLIAMAHVIVTESLHDRAFIDDLVLGFDENRLPPGAPAGSSYRSYLLGKADGVPKTAEWAEAITGVPAVQIRWLAREMATHRPAALHCGYAPGRTEHGEQFHRAAYALCAITGNVGVPGGSSGCSGGVKNPRIKRFTAGANPANARVASPLLADLLAEGRAGGYPADIRMIYSACGDLVNQLPNVNKTVAALEKLEFMVVHDHFLTPTARYADIVLPATTFWERNDIHVPWSGAGHYVIFMKQAIPPMDECRNDLDVCADLARRLGVTGYDERPELERLRELTADSEIDDFETFRARGLARLAPPADAVAFAREVREPWAHPFSTPSGRIEIYSTTIAARPDVYGLGAIPPIPTWIPPAPADPRHPLALVTPKSRARTHSIHANQTVLSRADPQDVWISTQDAAARGIVNGQRVRVFNDLGATVMPARVTERIAPGVVSIAEGAWFTPDGEGRDTAGCANVLTSDRPSPCGASTYNSCFVDVTPDVAGC
ncbi:MAG TPA: molybdopterin-dependent oxidoreductase [Candidatus Limnocylindrales bacterium]|nr:molybdopterin-dependent oxidoreductase [Candidatus Limnocylindrales bacterium]